MSSQGTPQPPPGEEMSWARQETPQMVDVATLEAALEKIVLGPMANGFTELRRSLDDSQREVAALLEALQDSLRAPESPYWSGRRSRDGDASQRAAFFGTVEIAGKNATSSHAALTQPNMLKCITENEQSTHEHAGAADADAKAAALEAAAPEQRHLTFPPKPRGPAPGLPMEADAARNFEAPGSVRQAPSSSGSAGPQPDFISRSLSPHRLAPCPTSSTGTALCPTSSFGTDVFGPSEDQARVSVGTLVSMTNERHEFDSVAPGPKGSMREDGKHRVTDSVTSVMRGFRPGTVRAPSTLSTPAGPGTARGSEHSEYVEMTKTSSNTKNIYDLDKLMMDRLFSREPSKETNGSRDPSQEASPSRGLGKRGGRSLPKIQQARTFLEDGSEEPSGSGFEGRRNAGTPTTLEAMRATRETTILQNFLLRSSSKLSTGSEPSRQSLPFSKLLFKVFGMVPFGHRWPWYRRFMLVMLLGLYSPLVLVTEQGGYFYMHLSGTCCALGILLALATLQAQHRSVDRLLGRNGNFLESYAKTAGFLQDWSSKSTRDLGLVSLVWISTLVWWILLYAHGADCVEQHEGNNASWLILKLLSPAVACLLFAMLVYFQLHICCNLELMVDMYCWNFFEDIDFNKAAEEWNKVQSLLRRTTDTTDTCFLLTQTSVLAASLLMGSELLLGRGQEDPQCVVAWASSSLPCLGLALYLLFRAAAISEKCSRVPAFINGLDEGKGVDAQRLYLVQYISNSAAGFYVEGVRLSVFIAVKATYLAGVLCFAFISATL